MTQILLLAIVVMLLNACGQSGKLYLPKPEVSVVNSEPSAKNSADATSEPMIDS